MFSLLPNAQLICVAPYLQSASHERFILYCAFTYLCMGMNMNHFECCDKEYIFINLTIWWLIFSCVLKHNGESTITSALYGFQQTSKLFSLWAWWPYPRWPVLSINDTVVTWSWSSRGWKPSKQFTGLFFMHGLYFQLTKKLIKISPTGGRQRA